MEGVDVDLVKIGKLKSKPLKLTIISAFRVRFRRRLGVRRRLGSRSRFSRAKTIVNS